MRYLEKAEKTQEEEKWSHTKVGFIIAINSEDTKQSIFYFVS